MSAIHVMEYIAGLGIFGFTYWLLDGIISLIKPVSSTDNPYTFILYVWIGVIIIYLIFGIIWLVRSYSELDVGGIRR